MTRETHLAAPALVAVVGAAGRSGRLVVDALLARGFTVRALVRDSATASAVLGDRVGDVVAVDVREPATLVPAMAGVRYVISTLGANSFTDPTNRPEMVDFHGIANLAVAAAAAGVQHLVLLSALGVTDPDHPLNRYGGVCTWKLKGEQALRDSGVPYTIVRPGGLTDAAAGTTGLRILQGDKLKQGTVPRSDLADVCVALLGEQQAMGTTFELVTDAGGAVGVAPALFSGLAKD